MRTRPETFIAEIDAAFALAMTPRPARPEAEVLAERIAANVAAIRRVVAEIRARRVWLAALDAANPGASRFYSDGAQGAADFIAGRRRAIRVDSRRRRALAAQALNKAA